MRKTYRKHGVQDYWQKRWDAVSVDAPMQNAKKYPLNCSLQAIGRTAVTDLRILEAGCGTGRLLRYFHDRGYDIIGIDFIDGAIKKILALNAGYRAEVGDITNLRFVDSSFSHVLAFGLYHNFEEVMMQSALDETYRVLQNNGVLCASFRADNIQNYINDRFFPGRMEQASKAALEGPKKFHKINLKPSEIKEIIERSGFKVSSISAVENMPLLYKYRFFRNRAHKDFDEVLARRDGYRLSVLGSCLNWFLKTFLKNQFCNLYFVLALKQT